DHAVPEVFGVVLNPTGMRIILRKLLLLDGKDIESFIEENCARRGPALVYGENLCRHVLRPGSHHIDRRACLRWRREGVERLPRMSRIFIPAPFMATVAALPLRRACSHRRASFACGRWRSLR